jgi:pimeloyl-ACP methyl ester carboxylesterase
VNAIRTRTYIDGPANAETIVLLHGGDFGHDTALDCFSFVLPVLARRYRVVAFDRLGQGYTDNPPDDSGFTIDGLMEHTHAVLDALCPEPIHLVGHSRGGFVATRVAIERPDRIRSLTIVDSNTTAPEDPTFPSGQFYRDLEALMPPGPPSLESVRIEPEAQAYDPTSVTTEFLNRMLAIAQLPIRIEGSQRLATADGEIWRPSLDARRVETLRVFDDHGLAVPTLVLWSRDDPSAPLRLGYALYERIAPKTADARLHVVSRSGHYPFRDRPNAFVAAVEAFVETCT